MHKSRIISWACVIGGLLAALIGGSIYLGAKWSDLLLVLSIFAVVMIIAGAMIMKGNRRDN